MGLCVDEGWGCASARAGVARQRGRGSESKGPPRWAGNCVKGRLTRRELARRESGIPMLAARVARCEVSRPGQRDIPTFAASELLGEELAGHAPTFPRSPYDISRRVFRACPAGFLGHAPRGFRSPHGLLTLSTESSRSPRSPYGMPSGGLSRARLSLSQCQARESSRPVLHPRRSSPS